VYPRPSFFKSCISVQFFVPSCSFFVPLGWHRTIVAAMGAPFPAGSAIVNVLLVAPSVLPLLAFAARYLVNDVIVSTAVTSFSVSSLLVVVSVAIKLRLFDVAVARLASG